MQVISLLSRKGGSGKSTLAIHWAVEAGKRTRIVLVDMDPQGSSSSWFQKRDAETPLLIKSNPQNIKEHLEACRDEGIDLVVIDTLPDIDFSAVEAARVSDLVIIPTRPSILDLEAIGKSVEVIQGVNRSPFIVINQAPARSSITEEAQKALSAYGQPVCPTSIGHRLIFSRALIDGRVASEIEPKGKAAIEIKKSWSWIRKQFERKER